MAAAQNGNARAYQALLGACVPIAAAAARQQGVPPQAVDDVVQDVLLTIHRARATYDPRRPFLPWLRAIAARRAIDTLRRQYRHRGTETQDEAALLAAPAQDDASDDTLDRAGREARVRLAIAALPPGQRQAVELLALQEQSLEQASGQTGRTKLALKVNLHRAIQALRRRLAQGSGDA